jgi:O-antigen biosynthesis protein
MKPKLSIIISTRNRFDEFMACLSSVLNYTKEPYDLYIIDAWSTDQTREFLNTFTDTRPESISVMMFNSNIPGYAQGNNIIMRLVQTKYIFLLNNDNIVTEGWEGPIISAMDDDETIGWMGPMILWPDNKVQSAGAFVTKKGASVSIFSGSSVAMAQRKAGKQIIDCHYLGFGMYRKDLLEKIGYLSEEYKHIYFDDTDFGLTMLDHGYKVQCHMGSQIYHCMCDKERERWVSLDPYSINQPVFFNKWKHTLERIGLND